MDVWLLTCMEASKCSCQTMGQTIVQFGRGFSVPEVAPRLLPQDNSGLHLPPALTTLAQRDPAGMDRDSLDHGFLGALLGDCFFSISQEASKGPDLSPVHQIRDLEDNGISLSRTLSLQSHRASALTARLPPPSCPMCESRTQEACTTLSVAGIWDHCFRD